MVRGIFFALLCGFFLVFAAPEGRADGGAASSNNSDNTAATSDSKATTDSGTTSGSATVSKPFLFIDVPAEHWAVEDLKYLVEHGVVTGLPNGAFNGDKPLTRYSAVALVARALRLMENNPKLVTKADFDALQELLFSMADKIEQNSAALQALPQGGTQRPETGAQVQQLSARLDQAESAASALKQELAKLKQDARSPQSSVGASQLNKIKQRANANFVLVLASLFVGIIGIALATIK